MKQGQGLSVNMIILIAMGLVVLIITIIILVKNTGKTNTSIGDTFSCPSSPGYRCVPGASCNDNEERDYRTCPNTPNEPTGTKQICCSLKPTGFS